MFHRIFNIANVTKLYLGLFFCQSPFAQKKVTGAASYLQVSKASFVRRPNILNLDIGNLSNAVEQNKIASSVKKLESQHEEKSIEDILKYLKDRVTEAKLKEMKENTLNGRLLKSSRSSGRSRVMVKRDNSYPRSGKQSPSYSRQKGKERQNSPKNINLQANYDDLLHTYRKYSQKYKDPQRLINLTAYSQLDPNSLFANQLR